MNCQEPFPRDTAEQPFADDDAFLPGTSAAPTRATTGGLWRGIFVGMVIVAFLVLTVFAAKRGLA